MKKFFSNQLVQTILVQVLLLGGLWFFFQKSFENSLVEKRLKKEIFMKEKREAYDKALEIAYRQIAIEEYDKNVKTGETVILKNRNRGATRPTELELNLALSKLYMYAEDPEILTSFSYIIAPPGKPYSPVPYMQSMLRAMNRDLGNPEPNKNFELLYIVSDTLPH
jgi:hypothetical protein